ncbi:MAG: hypothetical protein KHY62_01500 [Firmicutes bacterium]|nr:hypothetical protein [Bacillota bacterium]
MKIKGMDKDMRCRGFQFKVGKEYKKENNGRPLELCSDTVFHYCKTLQQVHNFYSCYDKNNRYFEIEVLGEEITDGDKCGSDHIRIVREIVGDELKEMMGLTRSNSGLFNSGNRNSGDRNSGDFNSGKCNSGNCNSGNFNSGNRNSGDRNSGDFNSGYCNSGNFNSGYRNSGDRNSGCCNSGYGSNGVFCNEDDKNIRIFNKPSGMSLKDFWESIYWHAICSAPFNLTEWIEYTQEEKKADPQKKLVGGHLRTYTMEKAWANWWNELTDENKEIIKQIPNFDPDVFEDITGIEI